MVQVFVEFKQVLFNFIYTRKSSMIKLLNNYKWILFLATVVLCVGAFYFSFTNKNSQSREVLKVGVNPFTPYVFIEEDESFNGFDIELAREIARRLGRKLEVKNMSFDALTIELAQGKVDCIIGGLSITEARQKKMNIIHYTGAGKVSIPLVFWRQIPKGVEAVEDLAHLENKVVCLQPGSLQEDLFARFPFVAMRFVDSITDMIMEIRYGKAIACALEHEVARAIAKKYQEIKVLSVPLPKDLQDYGIGIGLSKKSNLNEKIDTIIRELKKDGTIARMEQKWFEGEG